MSDDVELLIAGGGLIGQLLGVACAGSGLAVAIVDRQDPAALLADDFDGRSSAISYGSHKVLDAVRLWQEIAPDAEPIREIRVADGDSPLFLHYDHRELESGVPLGYIVENRILRRGLIDRVRSLPNLQFLAPLAVESVSITLMPTLLMVKPVRRLAMKVINSSVRLLDWYERSWCRHFPADSIRYQLRVKK